MFSYFMSGNSCSSKAIRLLSQQDNSALLNAMVQNSKAGQLLLYIYRITPGLILDIIATLPRFFVYQELARCNTEGYEFFTKLLACRQVTCWSVWPAGYVLILLHVEGKPLLGFLPQLQVALKRRCKPSRSFRI